MSDFTLLKYCPACSTPNPPTESFCRQCDFDLLTVLAEPRRPEPGEVPEAEAPAEHGFPVPEPAGTGDECRLELLENPAVSFQIKAGQSVGRGVEADIILDGVPHLAYISRRHAKFSRRGEQWFVQYVAEGNFLKVDGETYDDDSLAAIHDGSVLTLSLTSFRVVLT